MAVIWKTTKRYILNILRAIDRLLNVLFGGNDSTEMISSAVGRKAVEGRWWALVAERIIDWLFFQLTCERGHCRANIKG